MRSILVKDVLWRVSSILQDSDPQFTRWPEIELVQWLNDAQRALFKFLPQVGSRLDSFRLEPGCKQDITLIAANRIKLPSGASPTGPVGGQQLLSLNCNLGADGMTPGRAITIMDRQRMDASAPMWRTQVGSVVRQYAYDPLVPRTFFVSPGVPAIGQVWVEMAWTADPDPIPDGGAKGQEKYAFNGNSTTVIGVHDDNIDELVNYMAARSFFKDSKDTTVMARASMHGQMFLASLNARVQQATGTNPNIKVLPFMPEPVAAAS
jgi:hypothetical protein